MIDSKTRLFVPLPWNPLHSYDQSETDLKRYSESSYFTSSAGHIPSCTKNLQSNSTSDFTIIEIIKPDKQKHDSDNFIPAFAKSPYTLQDSSLESAILMNLGPLRASYMFTGPGDLQASPSVLASPPPFQPVSFNSQFSPRLRHHNLVHQQTYQSTADDSSFSDETLSSQIPDSAPLFISKSLTKVKVIFWVNELRRFLFLSETCRMSSAHAAGLHQLLCIIEHKMANPFLTPRVLGETSLGRVMKSIRHGSFDARSKEVARRIIQYWRKVCLEA